MLKRPFVLAIVALALFAGLAFGVFKLFVLRIEHGDVYPPYSTLRADPLGAKAIHDAIAELESFDVRRNYRPLARLKTSHPVTLVQVGVDADGDSVFHERTEWGREDYRALERMAAQGSRIVIALAPIELMNSRIPLEKTATTPPATPPANPPTGVPKEPESSDPLELEDTMTMENAAERWGFSIRRAELPNDEIFDRVAGRTRAADELGLEPQLTWHSPVMFRDVSEHWTVLYRCDAQAVLMERRYGDGSIVVASDSYFLSNEGLRDSRRPRLLAHLFGPKAVIFDESIHGVLEDTNIAQLARQYRLHGVIAGLALLAGLFVWKSAARFVPPRAPAEIEPGVVLGKDSEEGFIHLLRRSVPPAELLDVCVAEWKRSCDPGNRSKHSSHMDSVMAGQQGRSKWVRNAVTTYRTIAEGLATKRE